MMVLLLAAGCASSSAPATTQPSASLNNDEYGAVKSAYLAANPDARVGRVAAVLAAEGRASVEDIPVVDFRAGDVLSIVDGKLNPIANATVEELDADYLYIHFVPLTATSPAPVVGDMVIRAESPGRAQ